MYLKKRDAFVKTPGDDRSINRVAGGGGEGRFGRLYKASSGREAWKELLKKNLMAKGMRTVWNDDCEYDGVEDRNAYCDHEGMGGTMAELKIIQVGILTAYTGKEALKEAYPKARPYIINRAGYAGIQRYAQVWAGDNLTDWETVKFNIATLIGMGLSGMSNAGCDIGGLWVQAAKASCCSAGSRMGFSSCVSVSIQRTMTRQLPSHGCMKKICRMCRRHMRSVIG